MRDLSLLAERLLERPVLPRPPVEHVVALARRQAVRRRRRAGAVMAAMLAAASVAHWAGSGTAESSNVIADRGGAKVHEPDGEDDVRVIATDAGPRADRRPAGSADATSAPPTTAVPTSEPLRCAAGANGGATDTGVTATSIRINYFAIVDGPQAAPANQARRVVQSVIEAVNRNGGICGRRLGLRVRTGPAPYPGDDGFAAMFAPGRTDVAAYADSWTGDHSGIPVVGSDGRMAIHWMSPWVWPVGARVGTEVRIAALHAYRDLGARSFALVRSSDGYGDDAETALRAYIQTLPGATIAEVADSLASQVLSQGCQGTSCDAVIWADDMTAYNASNMPPGGRLTTQALSPLVGPSVAAACGGPSPPAVCQTLELWDPFLVAGDDPALDAYRAVADGSVDPLVESSYVAARVLIEALRRTGPRLTQDGLHDALNGANFDVGLTDSLDWAEGLYAGRAGNTAARALRIRNGQFIDAGTGWVRDPTPGVFP